MLRVVLAIALLLPVVASQAAPPVEVKSVPLDEFMHGQLKPPIKLPIPVPLSYEWAALSKAPVSYSYWMRAPDVAAANATGDLPSEHGYMYGKISTSVGYDEKNKVFMGANDPATLAKMKGMFSSVTTEHFTFGEYPVLLVSMSSPDSGKVVYAMYVGLNISTNAVYLAFRPPGNSKEIGDYVWSELKKALVK